MKRTLILAAAMLLAATAQAQSYITSTPRPYNGGSSFSIGPRAASYSTDVDTDFVSVKTGRQTSFGLEGDYRTGQLVIDFMYDHDPENGISLINLIGIDVGQYSRDRGEATIGFAVLPVLDLKAGGRAETIRVGGAEIFGNSVFSTLDLSHQALAFGARLHTAADRPVGAYLDGRGYVGTAKFNQSGFDVSTDTTGYRGEAGVSIPLGESRWSVVPAVEYEHLETKDYGLRLNTNRFMVNFLYHSRF